MTLHINGQTPAAYLALQLLRLPGARLPTTYIIAAFLARLHRPATHTQTDDR